MSLLDLYNSGLLLGSQQLASGAGAVAPAPAAAPRASLFDRVSGAMFPAPPELDGLAQPADVSSARRQAMLAAGLATLQASAPHYGPRTPLALALAQGLATGNQAFQGALTGAIGARQQAAALQRQNDILAARKRLAALYPDLATASPEQIRTAVPALALRYAQAGDMETAKELGDIGKLFGLGQKTPNRYQQTQYGKGVTTYDTDTGTFFNPETQQWEPAIARGMDEDHREVADRSANLRQQSIDNTVTARVNTQTNQFNSRVKPLRDRAELIDQALVTLEDAAHNPDPAMRRTLASSAVANFVQAADQKAQLRFQMLQYFKQNVDQSLPGKWEVLRARLLDGTLPQYSLEAMIKHLRALRALTMSQYGAQRQGEVQRHPYLDKWLPPTEEFFGAPTDSAAAGGGEGDYYKKFNLAPPASRP